MQVKFEIIWIKICPSYWIAKWYQFFLNTQYISSVINFLKHLKKKKFDPVYWYLLLYFKNGSYFREISEIYIYIYIYIHANIIEHNRHFMPTYSLLDPFEFPYYFYRIRGELIKVLSIVVCIPSTFCPTLGHHQGRICYKSDVTCFSKLLLCKDVFAVGDYGACF